MLTASKLDSSLIFSILEINLFLEFLPEPIPSVNGLRSSSVVVTLAIPPNKGNILKEESGIAHVLSIILNTHCLEICLESPQEIVDLPCTPSSVEGLSTFSFEVVDA